MTTPFDPQPCGTGSSGAAGADVEQTLLCDVGPDGDVLGTALAVYEYDSDGNPVGAPNFVDPATGLPYVAQGVLQPCAGDVACGAPVQFCFQSTAPVDQPGRMYDTTLTLAQGFAVQALVSDLVETPLNITWEVTDPDGTAFASALQTAIQSQFPGQTVTVTPGAVDPCLGGTADFAVHIECLRIDQDPPTLLQFKYNSGRDQIINPAFLSLPDTGTFAFLKRQDETSPVATGDVLCTSVAGAGWETNDINNSFETWGPSGNAYNIAAGTTPTPRGTVVQEINSYGSGAQTESPGFGDDPNTIWQTFTIPAAGNFTVRVVVGGRASTENIAIKLSTGDVDDAGIGDIINTSVNAVQVTTQDPLGNNTGTGTAGPWTTFNQVVPLGAGTYTLAFTGPPKPPGVGGNAFGGLFTDMRVFQDAPNTIEPFVNDDDTCTVPTNETSTTCEFWAPRCAGGDIVGWYNVADGEELTNAAFWAQVPAPTCCPTGSGDGGSSSTGNLVHSYLVCGTLNGERRTMSRVVVTDQAGGIIADTFVDTDGGPVTPDTWQPGDCSGGTPGFTEVAPTCEALGSPEQLGPDLIQNGDFASSAGTGTASQEGPGWATTLTPSGDVSLANPATFALFDTFGAAVSTEPAADFQADSGPTMLISADPTDPVKHLVTWKSVYLETGKTYRFKGDFANVAGLWGVELNLGNDQLSDIHVIPAPAFTLAPVTLDAVFNGTTGIHGVHLSAIGNPNQVFGVDNVQLWEVTPAVAAAPATVGYSDTVRAVVDHVVPTAGCNDDRRDGLLTDVISQLVELRPDAVVDADPVATTGLCLSDGTPIAVVVHRNAAGTVTQDGWINLTTGAFTAGNPPVGTVACGESRSIQVSGTFCDVDVNGDVLALVLIEYSYNPDGTIDTVRLVDATTGTTYVPVGTITTCPEGTPQPEQDVTVLCDVNAGVATPFIRDYRRDELGAIVAVSNYTLAGAAYVPTGAVGLCDSGCGTAASLGTVCYTPPVAVQTLQDDWTGATSVVGGGSRVWTNANFAGIGLTVTETVTPDTGAALLGNGVRTTATSPATQHTVIDLGAPRTNVTIRLDFFGLTQGERLRNVTPAFAGVSGNGTAVLGNSGVDGGPAADGTIFLNFVGPVQTISWDYSPTGGGLSNQSVISFNSGNASNSAPAAVLRDCDTGTTTYIDLATGTVLNPALISIVDCPSETVPEQLFRDSEQILLCDSTPTQFLRTFVRDGNGTLVTVVNSTLAGAPFVPVGAVGVCTSDDVTRTLTAQARVLTNATPWTPGADVAGVLTSLTVTGTSGLWDMVDQNGTALTGLPAGLSLSWAADDDNILTGPTSITPQAGATVVANWTQR